MNILRRPPRSRHRPAQLGLGVKRGAASLSWFGASGLAARWHSVSRPPLSLRQIQDGL